MCQMLPEIKSILNEIEKESLKKKVIKPKNKSSPIKFEKLPLDTVFVGSVSYGCFPSRDYSACFC